MESIKVRTIGEALFVLKLWQYVDPLSWDETDYHPGLQPSLEWMENACMKRSNDFDFNIYIIVTNRVHLYYMMAMN